MGKYCKRRQISEQIVVNNEKNEYQKDDKKKQKGK